MTSSTIFSPGFVRYVHPLSQIPLNLASQQHSSWSNRFWLKVIKSKDNSGTKKMSNYMIVNPITPAPRISKKTIQNLI